jgi:hypothetical protein
MSDLRPLARTDRLLTETLHDELLVYDLDGNNAVHLNRTAALVWRNCDGRRTVQDLVTIVQAELGDKADEDVVLMALDSLSERGLISSGYEERDGQAVALSRRRFFRRVGAVGALAINAPVVYSAIIPPAAAAVSHGGGGGGGGSGDNSDQFLNNSSGSSSFGSGSSGSGSSGSGSSGSGSSDSYP